MDIDPDLIPPETAEVCHGKNPAVTGRIESQLTKTQAEELGRLLLYYQKKATRCKKAKAYLAGCIILAAAMECSLILFTNRYFNEAVQTGKAPKKKGEGVKPLIDWKLDELLRVARAANWLPSEYDVHNESVDPSKVKIGDLAQMLQMLRNLVHPARYMRDHPGLNITKNHFENSLTIYGRVREWIIYAWEQRTGSTLA